MRKAITITRHQEAQEHEVRKVEELIQEVPVEEDPTEVTEEHQTQHVETKLSDAQEVVIADIKTNTLHEESTEEALTEVVFKPGEEVEEDGGLTVALLDVAPMKTPILEANTSAIIPRLIPVRYRSSLVGLIMWLI